LTRQKFNVCQVYTFGQPRVGNRAFKALYESCVETHGQAARATTFRVVYQEDIVARVPHLPAWRDPYCHVGTEIFVSSVDAGDLWIDPPLLRLLISDAWGIWRAWCIRHYAGAIEPMRDHHINNYVVAMSNASEAALPSHPPYTPPS